MKNLTPLHDIVIIKEEADNNNFSVSELSKGLVIKVGIEVSENVKVGDVVYFYKGNNRKIDSELSYVFSEDCLFIEGDDK